MIKRKISLFCLIFCGVLVGGCQRVTTGEQAATLFIQGEFYLREHYQDESFSQAYAQTFGERITDATLWETETLAMVNLAKQDVTPAVRKELGKALSEAISQKTTFTVEALASEAPEQLVTVAIKGLDLAAFKQTVTAQLEQDLIDVLHQAGHFEVTSLADLTALTSSKELTEIQQLITDYQANTAHQQQLLLRCLKEMKAQVQPQEVVLTLIPPADSQQQWEIKDKAESLAKLTEAFLK